MSFHFPNLFVSACALFNWTVGLTLIKGEAWVVGVWGAAYRLRVS